MYSFIITSGLFSFNWELTCKILLLRLFFQIPNGFSPNSDVSKENYEEQNDSNNNFKNLTYTPLTTPHIPQLAETPALNLIYREKIPEPAVSYDQNYLEVNSKAPSLQEHAVVYSSQTEINYTSESNSSSCLSEIRVDDEGVKKSDEEKEDQEKQKPYKCEDCGKQFSQLRNYKYHR